MLTKRSKKKYNGLYSKHCPVDSITLKMKMIETWLGPGMAQGVASLLFFFSCFFFAPSFVVYKIHWYNSMRGCICVAGSKMRVRES